MRFWPCFHKKYYILYYICEEGKCKEYRKLLEVLTIQHCLKCNDALLKCRANGQLWRSISSCANALGVAEYDRLALLDRLGNVGLLRHYYPSHHAMSRPLALRRRPHRFLRGKSHHAEKRHRGPLSTLLHASRTTATMLKRIPMHLRNAIN
jgi:hypothetical protein